MSDKTERYASMLAQHIFEYHRVKLVDDQTLLDAVIVKSVALVALAFEIPPTDDDNEVDIDDTIESLRRALMTIRAREKDCS